MHPRIHIFYYNVWGIMDKFNKGSLSHQWILLLALALIGES